MMLAPIDARATLEAAGETLTLVMDYRTIALAEDAQPDAVMAFGRGKPKLSNLATLLWAFAQPHHPDLTQDVALALVMREGEAVGSAVARVFTLATKGAEAPDAPPSRPRRTKAA